MKFYKILFLLFFSLNCYSQDNIKLLDTVNSVFFKTELLKFYKGKYDEFNSNLNLTGQNKLSKTIYLEYQEEFLEKIKNDNFVADKSINDYAQKILLEILEKIK